MSRTYRRLGGDTTWKDWYRELAVYNRKYGSRKRYDAYYHSDGYRGMTTPSWWIRQAMTRPQRQQVARLVHKVLRLTDLQDCPLFPLAKKPHIYYW